MQDTNINFDNLPSSISEFFTPEQFAEISEYEKQLLSNLRQHFEALRCLGLPVNPPEFMLRNRSETERHKLVTPAVIESSGKSDSDWTPAVIKSSDRSDSEWTPAVIEPSDGSDSEWTSSVIESSDGSDSEWTPSVIESSYGSDSEWTPSLIESSDGSDSEWIPALEKPKRPSNQHSEKDLGKSSSHLLRRSSRIQGLQQSTTPSTSKLGLADSAYDADEESVTPNSSPDQISPLVKDPYEFDITDDVPIVRLKRRRKNNTKKATKFIPTKTYKKNGKAPVSSQKTMPTSTPVLNMSGSSSQSLGESSLPVTAEVTPILPYKTHDCASSTDSFVTPQIHRPSRKHSLLPDQLVSLSSELSYSSPGDSGIALSPMTKKAHTSSDTENHDPRVGPKSQKTNIIDNHMKKEQKQISSVDLHKMNKKNHPVSQVNVPEILTMKQIYNKNKSYSDQDSCFGFESPVKAALSPGSENSPPAGSKQAKSAKKTKKQIVSKEAYRSARTNSSDCSLTCLTNDRVSLGCAAASQESVPRVNSALLALFSDSSADSEPLELEVNKTTAKSYKSFKIRRTNNSAVTKLDEWASNFNMEIEDTEKFDLNIE
ncbi:hypothetical protein BsWGS_10865 [Bradybaena similaris]